MSHPTRNHLPTSVIQCPITTCPHAVSSRRLNLDASGRYLLHIPENCVTKSLTPSDTCLLAAIARGDRAALHTLFVRHYRGLCRFAYRLLGRADLVEEIVNDTFLVAWQKAGEFRGEARVSTWLMGIVYRKSLKALRASPGPGTEVPLDTLPELEAVDVSEAYAEQDQAARLLRQAFAVLNPEQRAVVELTYFHDYSYEEIAAALDCPTATVKTRMFYARRRLRGALAALASERGVRA